LDADRPVQSAEEAFFQYFADKKVPLVFVFTKYDKLVNQYMFDVDPEIADWTPSTKQKAEQKAKDYVHTIREKLQRATGRGVTVKQVSKTGTSFEQTYRISRPLINKSQTMS
jgi:GTP-binding protein EngB required for normal cell division